MPLRAGVNRSARDSIEKSSRKGQQDTPRRDMEVNWITRKRPAAHNVTASITGVGCSGVQEGFKRYVAGNACVSLFSAEPDFVLQPKQCAPMNSICFACRECNEFTFVTT
jgi:hypothetical protein